MFRFVALFDDLVPRLGSTAYLIFARISCDDGLIGGMYPDVTASKMHACERATPMRYMRLRCKSCEISASIRCRNTRNVPGIRQRRGGGL